MQEDYPVSLKIREFDHGAPPPYRGLHSRPSPEFPEWYSAHALNNIDDQSIGVGVDLDLKRQTIDTKFRFNGMKNG